MIWMGLYPQPVLSRMDEAAKRYVQLVEPGFAPPATALTTPEARP